MSLRASRQHMRKRARELLVAGLLTPACRECPAASGDWCDPLHQPPAEMCRVDRSPPHLIHSSRLGDAVLGGHVSRRVLIAQFAGGTLPSVLT